MRDEVIVDQLRIKDYFHRLELTRVYYTSGRYGTV
jgi:hypothetical protein